MNGKIKVGTESIASSLNEFKQEMNKMELLFDEVMNKTSQVHDYWSGTVGDATVAAIQKLSEKFERIDDLNENYVKFLNTVIDKYTHTENKISSTIDETANTGLGINGSGI